MKFSTGKSIKYLFVSHLVTAALIALYSIFFGKNLQVTVLNPPHLLLSMLLLYSKLFLPVTAGSLFILVILLDSGTLKGAGRRDRPMITAAFLSSIPSALVFLFLVFYFEPRLVSKKEWLEELSEAGAMYLKEAESALASGDLEKSLAYADLYLYIDPLNKRALEIMNDIKIAMPAPDAVETKSGSQKAAPEPGDYFTGEKLASAAEMLLEKKEYPTALYYAQMAGSFSSSRKKAKTIMERAEEALSSPFSDRGEKEKLYDGKVEIRNFIAAGEYFNAYYMYHRFIAEFPEDSELREIGETLFNSLSENSFFHEEIAGIRSAPGKTGISFINRNDENGMQLVLAEKAVFSDSSVYLFDINIIDTTVDREIERHLYAIYGKINENILSMQCIGKESRIFFFPELVYGADKEKTTTLEISVPPDSLLYLGREETRLKKIRTSYLADNLEMLSAAGAGKTAPARELYLRFIRFFNFIFIQFLVLAAGVSFLKRRSDRSRVSLLLLPFVVLFVYLLENSIISLKSGVIRVFIEETGLVAAGVIYAAITFTEIAAAGFYAAKKISHSFREL